MNRSSGLNKVSVDWDASCAGGKNAGKRGLKSRGTPGKYLPEVIAIQTIYSFMIQFVTVLPALTLTSEADEPLLRYAFWSCTKASAGNQVIHFPRSFSMIFL